MPREKKLVDAVGGLTSSRLSIEGSYEYPFPAEVPFAPGILRLSMGTIKTQSGNNKDFNGLFSAEKGCVLFSQVVESTSSRYFATRRSAVRSRSAHQQNKQFGSSNRRPGRCLRGPSRSSPWTLHSGRKDIDRQFAVASMRVKSDKEHYFAAAHNGDCSSDIDGGGVVVPHLLGAEPIVNTSVPPFAISSCLNQLASSGLPLIIADCT
jgi:hypothetical protein